MATVWPSGVVGEVVVGEASWRVVTFVLGAVPILGAVWLVARHIRFLKQEKAVSSAPSGHPVPAVHRHVHGVTIAGNMGTNLLIRLKDDAGPRGAGMLLIGVEGGGPEGLENVFAQYRDDGVALRSHRGVPPRDVRDDSHSWATPRSRHLPKPTASLQRYGADTLSGLPVEDQERLAEASHRSIDQALAELMVRLGPPPRPQEQPLQPTGAGDGGKRS